LLVSIDEKVWKSSQQLFDFLPEFQRINTRVLKGCIVTNSPERRKGFRRQAGILRGLSRGVAPSSGYLDSRPIDSVLRGPTDTIGMNKFGTVTLGCGSTVALEAFPHPARTCR
jgi:hypothetical protein